VADELVALGRRAPARGEAFALPRSYACEAPTSAKPGAKRSFARR